jgi:hypothetical protein
MSRLLKWALRPAVLSVLSVLLLGAAILMVFQPEPAQLRPQPLPVAAGEQEVAFLYPATNTSSWDRFVAAVNRAGDHLRRENPGLEVLGDAEGDSPSEQVVPSVTLNWPGRGRLVIRWYKLTSDWSPKAWIEALLARTPPPLAIIGGNTSNGGREVALQLARAGARLAESARPLLLLTTASADHVVPPTSALSSERAPSWPGSSAWRYDRYGKNVELTSLYAGRTFRFCFTNRQMATAVTRFLWIRPELQPDSDPAYLTRWMDDAYSEDLFEGYNLVLDRRAMDSFTLHWAFVSGCVGLGAHPVHLAGWYTSTFRHEKPVTLLIDSSVGSFASPNPYEANIVKDLLGSMGEEAPDRTTPAARRPLLVVTGQVQPSRRFLRELARSAPLTARRFVVAMGDTVSFNTVYRDRHITWPIQDLPFATVFFSHRNPIDADAGFRPRPSEVGASPAPGEEPAPRRSSSGTEDLLLFEDVVEALGLAFAGEEVPSADAQQLRQRLLDVRFNGEHPARSADGPHLFREDGQRRPSTGETVVYLRPRFSGEFVRPEATIEVWCRQTQGDQSHAWSAYGRPLTISYDEDKVQGEKAP